MARTKPAKSGTLQIRAWVESPELYAEICGRLASGRSLTSVCLDKDMPSIGTVLNWLNNPQKSAFLTLYVRACEARADFHAEEMLDIADNSTNDNADAIRRAQLRIETRKWLNGKLKPKKYGDAIKFQGDKDNPLVVETTQKFDATKLSPEQREAVKLLALTMKASENK